MSDYLKNDLAYFRSEQLDKILANRKLFPSERQAYLDEQNRIFDKEDQVRLEAALEFAFSEDIR